MTIEQLEAIAAQVADGTAQGMTVAAAMYTALAACKSGHMMTMVNGLALLMEHFSSCSQCNQGAVAESFDWPEEIEG